MKITKVLCLISAIAILASCASVSDVSTSMRRKVFSYGDTLDKEAIKKDIDDSEFAFIIGRFDGRNEWLNINRNYKTGYEKNYVVELGYSDLVKKTYDIYKVVPGKYTLVFYSVDYENNHAEPLTQTLEQNEKIKRNDSYYASFEAVKGQVVYVGDISFFPKEYFNVINNKADAVEYIKKVYINLKDPEKLIKYVPVKEGKEIRDTLQDK